LLHEFMQPLGLSQNELADTIDVPPRRINQIVHGQRAMTADTALRLSKAFGLSDMFWINMQSPLRRRNGADVPEGPSAQDSPDPDRQDRLTTGGSASWYATNTPREEAWEPIAKDFRWLDGSARYDADGYAAAPPGMRGDTVPERTLRKRLKEKGKYLPPDHVEELVRTILRTAGPKPGRRSRPASDAGSSGPPRFRRFIYAVIAGSPALHYQTDDGWPGHR
jgi:addiction module HigA family antidote